jgi:hypothetical protein
MSTRPDIHERRDKSARRDEPVGEAVRRGQWWATPLVVLGSVATVVWIVAGAITAGLLLIWWLL